MLWYIFTQAFLLALLFGAINLYYWIKVQFGGKI
jgi:hypothetical protein